MTAVHDEHAVLADLFQPIGDDVLAALLAAEELYPTGGYENEVQGD